MLQCMHIQISSLDGLGDDVHDESHSGDPGYIVIWVYIIWLYGYILYGYMVIYYMVIYYMV
jgi:hypothetical protein